MSNTRYTRRGRIAGLAATVAIPTALVAGLAGPAFASSGPSAGLAATAVVTTSVTISADQSALAFTGAAGTTFEDLTHVNVTVTTNDAAGAVLSWVPDPSGKFVSGANNFPTSAMSMAPTTGGFDLPSGWSNAGTALTLAHLSAAGTMTPGFQYELAFPSTAVPGSYTANFTYLATAN